MNVKEWLKETYTDTEVLIRPRIICKDGFGLSVQAGRFHNCCPKENRADGEYVRVEAGMPSRPEPLLYDYAEDESNYTGTIYSWVPTELINRIIEKHGGIMKCHK